MKILSMFLALTRHEVASSSPDAGDLPVLLCSATDLSSFGYFERKTVREMMTFLVRTLIRQTDPGFRNIIKHQQYVCHLCVAHDNLAGAVFTDDEYPSRVAFTVLAKAMEDFRAENKLSPNWRKATQDNMCAFPLLDEHLRRFQDPQSADVLFKIMQDLDETKAVLLKTIEMTIDRGRKLDELVEKSNDLSAMSKTFYKQAKDLNRCRCVIL